VATRFKYWKTVFMEQRRQGTLEIWAEPFTVLWVPKLFNLRMDWKRWRRHSTPAAEPRTPHASGSALDPDARTH